MSLIRFAHGQPESKLLAGAASRAAHSSLQPDSARWRNAMSTHPWLADRTAKFDSSGIRKVFDLAAKMANPINLSIGQPDFPVPDAIKEAAIAAIRGDKNGYSVTQGIPELLARLQRQVDERVPPRRSPRAGHLRHERRARAGRAGDDQSGRRSDRVRSVLRDVPGAGGDGRRPMRDGRHLSGLSHRSCSAWPRRSRRARR